MNNTEWFGEIPSNWGIKKIQYIFKNRNVKVSDKEYEPLSVTKSGIYPQLENVAKSNDSESRKLVYAGDFVINSRSDRKQSCGISPYDGSVSLINTVIYPYKNSVDMNFIGFLFDNYGFAEEFYRWGHGIVADLWTTRWQEMANIEIPVPPISVQKDIYIKLVGKSQKIDQLILNQQQQIEKLKEYKQSLISEVVTKGLDPNVELKESTIEIIDYIPKEWETIKMKYLGESRNGLTYSPNDIVDFDEGTLVLRSSNVKEGRLVFDDNVYVKMEIKEDLMVNNGDILICSRNGSRDLIGKNAIIENMESCSFGAFMMIFRVKNAKAKYIKYILDSSMFKFYLGTYLTATINQLTISNFNNMKVIYTSKIEEQEMIISYLDEKCDRIDKLIKLKANKLNYLEQYKKSLIYEYVTGKKEVS